MDWANWNQNYMKPWSDLSHSHDPIHGYIPFVGVRNLPQGEAAERQVIDHPWVQRLRQIHQLQTAWWVYPSAEHTRFQHVLGAMHLAARAVEKLYPGLREHCPETPSYGYVMSLTRMAALLHDVGHGPFGHFFDEHFLKQYGLTHETLGQHIIKDKDSLGDLLGRIRRSPTAQLEPGERLDPAEVALLIARPKPGETGVPKWLRFLRTLFCGIYTLDNMDFVLRDAYMSGYSARAFDIDRILQYSQFTEQGLTINSRGVDALLRFMAVRSELFRALYFHRTVRAIDLTLRDLFLEGKDLLFPGNPLQHLAEYQRFTEFSLLVDVGNWDRSEDPRKQALAPRWRAVLERRVPWVMLCERRLVFDESQRETSSIFANEEMVAAYLERRLPSLKGKLRVDLARHTFRPHTDGPAAGQNWQYDQERGTTQALSTDQLFSRMPLAHRICRVYGNEAGHAAEVSAALDQLLGNLGEDDITNV